jgi:uncharacterized protein (TIGR00251 family)
VEEGAAEELGLGHTEGVFDPLRQRFLSEGNVTFSVRIHPGAPRSHIKEVLSDGTLKVDIAAASEEGKANAELIRFLAEEFHVPKSHVEILRGHMAKRKDVRIRAA